KTVDKPFTAKTLNLKTNEVTEATLPPATPEEVEATIKVMGGEDWADWMHALKDAGVLAPNGLSIAYSYIGSKITYPIYYEGTIGAAKQDLYKTAEDLRKEGFNAVISVNKALVTQSSSAIPIVPLYVAVMYRVMKDKNVHEGTIQQMSRLWHEYLSKDNPAKDDEGRIRIDDLEMRDDVQETIFKYWDIVNNDNLKQYADVEGYWNDFYNLFGFGFDNVDYDADVNPDIEIDLVK
ncbi:MAG TPA: bifunctional NADH-specific enoyl-ACP reductase/trans-2-enoyl-CoA reductase, partial [Megamonas hypermegale]|nr:bifunctional NADH-specific enoyl-ACP reductase/trans-2-enoyl-CoA reductase [Megamonas hypermegale]